MTNLWLDKPYHSLDYEAKKTFGKKLYRLALDGGMTCPNRDGNLDYRGCIFCSAGGSGDFAANADKTIHEQLCEAKERIKGKLPKDKPYGFIAYFQAYTNTYAPAAYLRKIFYQAIEDPEVLVLSIATRPDCLPEEVLELLEELNRIKPVWIELGLQSIHEDTARWMRRGYGLTCFEEAVKELQKRKIAVIAHVIIGLKEEDEERLLETIAYLNHIGIDGVKLQLLHVLKDTDLEAEYGNGAIEALSFEAYEALLFAAITHLDKRIVIHRITGDGPKKLLVAPLWSADKKKVLNTLARDMKEQKVYQGKYANEESM